MPNLCFKIVKDDNNLECQVQFVLSENAEELIKTMKNIAECAELQLAKSNNYRVISELKWTAKEKEEGRHKKTYYARQNCITAGINGKERRVVLLLVLIRNATKVAKKLNISIKTVSTYSKRAIKRVEALFPKAAFGNYFDLIDFIKVKW